MSLNESSRTLFDKIWESHVIDNIDDSNSLLYIDLHLVHEVTSPQAFEGLRLSNRKVRQPNKTFAVPDHNVPTLNRNIISDELSKKQLKALEKNTKDFNISYFSINDVGMAFWLFLAGANTLIPLGFYLYGSSLAGLGPAAMIFFLAPTGQFLLGFYYYNEILDLNKMISFVVIWIAVAIYLRDLAKDK